MDTSSFDKETMRAWQGWAAFTRVGTAAALTVIGILVLMALFLL